MAITSIPLSIVLQSFDIPFRVNTYQPKRSQRLIAAPSIKDSITITYAGIVYSCTKEEQRQLKEDLNTFLRNPNGFYVKIWDGRRIKVRLPSNTNQATWAMQSDTAAEVSFTVIAYDPCFENENSDIITRYDTP